MTLVLNTLEPGDYSEQINAIFSGVNSEIEIINTSEMNIAQCIGCNQCWLRTPGVCAIRDDYESIVKKLVNTRNLWIVSDTRFGFIDYRGKKVLDRIMPMLNMYLTFRDGWMRHELRYHALNVGLIYKGNGNQELLEEWCQRTAANLGGRSLGVIALDKDPLPIEASHEIVPTDVTSEVALEKHVVIINGSPRAKKFSNTDKILQSFTKGLEEAKTTYELYSLSNRSEWADAREAFMAHNRIIIALPLFVECAPGTLLEFLETLPTKREQSAQLSFILHGGFQEGHQLRLCEKFLESLPAQFGCVYGGCLVRGGTFMIRVLSEKQNKAILLPYRGMGEYFIEENGFLSPEVKKFSKPEQIPWHFRKFVTILFKTVLKKKFNDFAKEWGCTEPLNSQPYATKKRASLLSYTSRILDRCS